MGHITKRARNKINPRILDNKERFSTRKKRRAIERLIKKNPQRIIYIYDVNSNKAA